MSEAINGVRLHMIVTFCSIESERSVTGRVIELQHGCTPNDYANVVLDVDGMQYVFGTGGHLGTTWTTESGMEEWYYNVR